MTHNARDEMVQELEHEIGKRFAKNRFAKLKDRERKNNAGEFGFFEDVLRLHDSEEKMYQTKEQCVGVVMTCMGEASIMARRLRIMRECKKWTENNQEGLVQHIELFDMSYLHVLKNIARFMGFYHPSDVMNRFITLRNLKRDSQREQEELNEAYSQMDAHHLHIKSTIGKTNLLLGNQMASLSSQLFDLEIEIKDLTKNMQTALKLSNDSSRLAFQITSTVHNLHEKVTIARGFPTTAITVEEKLDEIKTRLKLMSDVVNIVRKRAGYASLQAAVTNKVQPEDDLSFNASAMGTTKDDAMLWINNDVMCDKLRVVEGYSKLGSSLDACAQSEVVPAICTSRRGRASSRFQNDIVVTRSNSAVKMTNPTSQRATSTRRKVSFFDEFLGVRGGIESGDWANNFEINNSLSHRSDGEIDHFKSQSITARESDRERSTRPEETTATVGGETSKMPHLPDIHCKMYTPSKGPLSTVQEQCGRRKTPFVLPPMRSSTALDSIL